MDTIDKKILDINKAIEKNISIFDESDRGLLSQNILSQLRNLIEYIFLKIYNQRENKSLELDYDNLKKAEKYVKMFGKFKFLYKFHNLLQISVSHYTLDEDASERLMLKYYEYLLKIKSFLLKNYNLKVFSNLDDFPINTDKTTQVYYEKVKEKLDTPYKGRLKKDRYYIQKIKPFFIDNEVYYEVTFTKSYDFVSKFDRIIAFTKLDLTQNYAVNFFIRKDYIQILGKKIPINIIEKWEVSIRPCELNNFARIFGMDINIQSSHEDYKGLMNFLTQTGLNLLDIIEDQNYYKNKITKNINKIQFFNVLDKCRDLLINNKSGSNVIRYLLYNMNNKIIKQQLNNKENSQLSNLLLKYGCIPFDEMPFTTSLVNHNPRIHDLFECIDYKNREYEFLARFLKNNTEIKGRLFTSNKELERFKNYDDLIKKYNQNLYKKHANRRINYYKNKFYYIKGYVENTIQIINNLKKLSKDGIKDYTDFVQNWLQTSKYEIDCEDKKKFLINIFKNSKVAMIYGAAGTGKSTMINHISNLFNEKEKIYLAHTNTAVDNLKRKVRAEKCSFMTIKKFLSYKNNDKDCFILFIDECSTVSNEDMVHIFEKASFKLLVLVGDIFQIESIRFGNWFEIAKEFLPKSSIFELTKPFRSKNQNLINFWEKVRNIEDDITEQIQRNGFSSKLDDSIFKKYDDDEIVLCLNYDGLYGINNINRYLQANNSNQSIEWDGLIYKVNDPILFNETKRFGDIIYNNLKGRIVDIKLSDRQIEFHTEIDRVLNRIDEQFYDFKIESIKNNKTVISFKVNKYKTTDEDNESSDTIVPFQVAYAVSIHKAQGLEYNSVKIVITDEIEEKITHNIFYTAITRAKENLKIYWSPETENKVLARLKRKDNRMDVGLLKAIIKQSKV